MIRVENIVVSFDLGGGQEHLVLDDLSLEQAVNVATLSA